MRGPARDARDASTIEHDNSASSPHPRRLCSAGPVTRERAADLPSCQGRSPGSSQARIAFPQQGCSGRTGRAPVAGCACSDLPLRGQQRLGAPANDAGGLPLSRFTRIRESDADTLNDSARSLAASPGIAKPDLQCLADLAGSSAPALHRAAHRHLDEFTFRTGAYALTRQDLCLYSPPLIFWHRRSAHRAHPPSPSQPTMTDPLQALEQDIHAVVALCQRLREENQSLRGQLAQREADCLGMTERMGSAKQRLQSLLAQLPQDAASL